MHDDPRDCVSLEDGSYRFAILHNRLTADLAIHAQHASGMASGLAFVLGCCFM